MHQHWRLVYKGGRHLWHRQDKEQAAAEEARNRPAGEEARAEAVA